jgi:hypothetical protein
VKRPWATAGLRERAAGPREPEAPRLRESAHVGAQGARGGIVGGVPLQHRLERRPHAAGSPPGAPRSRDMRCPGGSGWGEALVTDPASRKSADHPDERCRTARALRPLTRETSAGGARRVGWQPPKGLQSTARRTRVARLGQASRAARRAAPPGSGGATRRMASTPSGGLLPVQRKLGAPRRRKPGRGSVDLVVVLVD